MIGRMTPGGTVAGRITSGHDRLDAVLHGGLVDPSVALVAGPPGTGKTVLAHQCAFANGTARRPAIYFSSLSEPMGKILRFASGLDFFDAELIGSAVLFEDLGSVLNGNGMGGALSKITELVARTECAVVVIDSLGALRVTAKTDAEFHRFTHELAGRLTAFATTSLWLAEYDADEVGRSPEAAVADAVVQLSPDRTLRVHKLRGSGFLPGPHRYRIGSGGIETFPRHIDVDGPMRSFGTVTVFDGLLEDCPAGTVTLVVGEAGTGKTALGLQFARHERTVFATAGETHWQIARLAEGLGLGHEGIEFWCDRSRAPDDLDEWSYDLFALVERIGARRLVVDGVTDLPQALLATCAHAGVTTLVTANTVPADSGVVDNVVLLQHARKGASLVHALTVLKTRSSPHLPQTREFEITEDGIRIGQPIDPS